MSITFQDAILAGMTLIREAIQSQNYQAGVAGWRIAASGEAEFADLTIRSSDGSGATVEIENGKAIFTAANGWQIIIDPTNDLPVIYFLDGDGDEAGALNATGDNTRSGVILSSGPFTDGPITDWRWATFLGEKAGSNSWHSLRLRDSDPDQYSGGWAYLDADTAQFAVVDSSNPAVNTIFNVTDGLFQMDQGRLLVVPTPSALPGLFVNVTAAGHTGTLLHLQREGSGKFQVDKDGNVSALGDVEALGSLVGSNIRRGTVTTPSVVGGGTSTNTVVFNPPMPNVPSVVFTPRTTVDPATVQLRAYADNTTVNGFTIRGYRSNASVTTWSWVAMCD
jgi:hypothetical protein